MSEPRYEQIDSPALEGLGFVARAQVLSAINCAMLTEMVDAAGGGTRWERMAGPRAGADDVELWEVEHAYEDGPTVTLKRIDANGIEIQGKPRAAVSMDYLRRGVAGWKRWSPPLEVIEGLGGQQ